MITQLDNALVTSMMLFIDHEIQRQGQAYSNKTGLFYPDENLTQGYYTYTCSYKQLCNDTSIPGANIMSGVYVNGTYTPVGSGGLVSINHYDGAVTFNQPLSHNTVVSGSFAVKDFNVYLSDQPDYSVMMSEKFSSNPKYAQQATGISQDTKVFPAVVLVPSDQELKPLSFGGLDDNYMHIRAMVVCENVYQRVAVCNILKNFKLRNLPIFNNIPFDYLGNYTGVNYNYQNLTYNTNLFPFISSVRAKMIPNSNGSVLDMTKQFAMVDFDISTWAGHK